METEEEKGFVIKDKRAFDEKGELKDKPSDDMEKKVDKSPEQPGDEPKKEKKKIETPPLPEVNFTTLIFSLSSSALLHLGEVADPMTNQKKKDLPLAKHTIDTISMLKEKTKGNLTAEEENFLESVLVDLKWRYVKAVK
jgi:hypothetical protein